MEDKLNAGTQRHIDTVRRLIRLFANELLARAEVHNQSKFSPEEAPIFDEFTPKLSSVTFGSEEYKAFTEAMGPAIRHHKANNRHHPEYFENGIYGMNLVDLVEMYFDWVASGRRHEDGNVHRSIDVCGQRFDLSPQVARVFHNTAVDLGDVLEIENQYAGRCKTCKHGLWDDGKGVQCALTSAPMHYYSGCDAHLPNEDP